MAGCSVLVCVKNRGNSGQLALDSKAWQDGDVICVMPVDWSWGACELGRTYPGNPNGNHPFWRVVVLPNVSISEASPWLSPEEDDANSQSPYLQRRGFFLDRSKIKPATMAALAAHWADDGRANGFITLNYTAAQINTIVSPRIPIPF